MVASGKWHKEWKGVWMRTIVYVCFVVVVLFVCCFVFGHTVRHVGP